MAYMILRYVPTERNGISQVGCLLYMEARNYWVTVKYGGGICSAHHMQLDTIISHRSKQLI